jgi:hypothetical protein
VSPLFGRKNGGGGGGGFDTVVVTLESGQQRRFTRKEFEALPLGDRVSSILRGKLRFYREGQEVPMKEAMTAP